jgi:hypothetical protein
MWNRVCPAPTYTARSASRPAPFQKTGADRVAHDQSLDFLVGFGILVLVAQYLQLVLDLTPLEAGLWDRAGIASFRWHDLRHTWPSWHVQNGTPLHVLQELGGWETPSMAPRYAHLAADHLAVYAGKVEFTTGTKAQIPHSNIQPEN